MDYLRSKLPLILDCCLSGCLLQIDQQCEANTVLWTVVIKGINDIQFNHVTYTATNTYSHLFTATYNLTHSFLGNIISCPTTHFCYLSHWYWCIHGFYLQRFCQTEFCNSERSLFRLLPHNIQLTHCTLKPYYIIIISDFWKNIVNVYCLLHNYHIFCYKPAVILQAEQKKYNASDW